MTASTLPPMPPPARAGYTVCTADYLALRSWAEACRAERDALIEVLQGMLTNAAPETLEVNHRYCVQDARDALAAIGLPDSSNSQGQEGGS